MIVRAILRRREGVRPRALVLAAVAASSLFGAAIGRYAGGRQILYGAMKMPAFLLGTLAISFAAMHVLAARRGSLEAAPDTAALTAVVLASLAPVAAFGARTCRYNFVVLLLTACVGVAGITGAVRLHARLASWRLTAVWIAIYQFVGAQTAWLLKPWVSHTGMDDRFLPLRENLTGNFYEAVLGSLLR